MFLLFTGSPSQLFQEDSPDWAPCLNIPEFAEPEPWQVGAEFDTAVPTVSDTSDTFLQHVAETAGPSSDPPQPCDQTQVKLRRYRDSLTELEVDKLEMEQEIKRLQEELRSKGEQLAASEASVDRKVQEKVAEIERIRDKEEMELKKELEVLQVRVKEADKLTFVHLEVFLESEEKVKFYTGLPSAAVFQKILALLSEYVGAHGGSLQHWQCLLLTLMRLRYAFPIVDLAFRFGVDKATVCRTFDKWLHALYECVYPCLVKWPSRETLWATMPRDFRDTYGNSVVVIIDCFEVFCDRASALDTRAEMWSNYKHFQTVKILLGMTPAGQISHVSTCWGGRASDKKVTTESGLYKLLLPNDVVMADRGFDIAEDLALVQAQLLVPAFLRQRDQLSSTEVELTRRIANLRIHIERVIGRLRNLYRILKHRLPIDFMIRKKDDELAPIDKIVRVCCALTNLHKSVVTPVEGPEDSASESEDEGEVDLL